MVTLFGALPVLAEVIALSATMSGGAASNFSTWVVAAALTFGICSVAAATVWPWLRVDWRSSRRFQVGLGVASILLLLGSVSLLREGVDVQLEQARLAEIRNSGGLLDSATVLSAYDLNLARSEVEEALLREYAAGLKGKARAEARDDISKLLIKRLDVLDKRFKAALDVAELNRRFDP